MHQDPETWVEVDGNGVGWEVTYSYASHQTVYDQNDREMCKQLPVVVENFRCGICDCEAFEAFHHNPAADRLRGQSLSEMVIGPGQPRCGPDTTILAIIGYRCPGCTTHFDDPSKFSRNKPPEVVPPMATERPNRFAGLNFEPLDLTELIKDCPKFTP